jgi:hypothetical protein
VAEVADVALHASRAWPLQVACHMGAPAVDASVIHLAPLLLAIVAAAVAHLGLFALGRPVYALR